MWTIVAKALLAGAMIAAIAEIGRRLPATAAIVASLPLVSVLGMIFLWHAKPDAENMAVHAEATVWYVLPSLPMFLLMCTAVALIYIFPGIVTWLPQQMATTR